VGNVSTRTDPRGNEWDRNWDQLRRLTEEAAPSPLSHTVRREYDENGNLTKLEVENRDKDGDQVTANPWFTTTYTWSNTDRLLTIVEEIDSTTTRTTSFEYDANDNRIRIVKPEGNKEKWTVDERDLVVSHVLGETDPDAVTVSRAYDDNGNLTVVTDGRGHDTTRQYDLYDRLTRVTDELGHYTAYTLDENGNVTRIEKKDSSNNVLQRESYAFDERNRLYEISALFKDPSTTHSDAVTTITRDKTGLVVEITDPRNHDTDLVYDEAKRRTEVVDANGNEREIDYDANGNPIAWRIKEQDDTTTITHEFEAAYDVANRRTRYTEIDRLNGSNELDTTYGYDSRGNRVWMVNAEGDPTRWTFDGLSRMVKRERALAVGTSIEDFTDSQDTEWEFDDNSRLTGHTDDGSNETTWAHDALDRVTRMTFPDAKFATYEYDAAHNVTKTVDPAGNEIEDTFDDLNRNTGRTVTLATGFLGTTSETRAFDAVGRITSNADNDYKVEYEYAVIGLKSYVAKETQSYVGQTAYPKTVTKTFDETGNRVTEVYPSGASLSLSLTYDDINQLTGISDGTNDIASYEYVGWRRKEVAYESGATTKIGYTGFRNEIASIEHETSILHLEYGYNDVHDRLYERFGGSGSSGDAFEYDKLRRLTKAWMGSDKPESPSGEDYVETIEYNYDDDGNRSSVVTTPFGQSASTESYTTNNLNQYTAVGGTSRSHDDNGNLIDDGVRKFEYNYKNLIVKVRWESDDSLIATYKYDAEGRRVEKSVVSGPFERYIRSRAREDAGSHRIAAITTRTRSGR